MAAVVLLKKGASRLALPSVTRALSAPSFRAFSNSAQVRDYEDDRSLDIDRREDVSPASRRRDLPGFFSDAFDPFFPSKNVSHLLNIMDQFMDNPMLAASRGLTGGSRRGWDVREDGDALRLRIDMPGLDKENVKVSAEQNTLIIRGEAPPESEDEESGRRYSSRIDIPPNLYKLDQIKAEMKNGVLKVTVPKVKENERSDVFHVKID